MSKFIKNTSIYTIGAILPKAAQFILLPIYSQYLTPEDYGIVQSMLVLSAILTIVFTFAVDRSVYRLYFDFNSTIEKRNFLGTVTTTLLLVATLMLIVSFLCKPILSQIFKSIPFYPFYVYALVTTYLSVFSLVPRVYFQVEQKAGKFVLISLLDFIVSTVLILYFITVAHQGAEGMLLAQLVKSVLFIPFFVFITVKIVNFTFNRKILRDVLKFSLPMVPALLSAFVLNLSDRIFIERFFTLKDVGIYSISYKLAEILIIVSGSLFSAYNPLFYKIANQENQIEAKQKLFVYNKAIVILLLVISTAIALFSEEFINLFNDQYKNAYTLVPIIVLGIFIGQAGGLMNLSIYQMKKSKQIMYLILISAIVNVGLNFILVPRFGSFGAALATTITFLIFFVIKAVYIKKCYYIPFAWKETLSYLATAMAIVLVLLKSNLEGVTLIVSKIIGMIFLLTIISINNRKDIAQVVKRRNK